MAAPHTRHPRREGACYTDQGGQIWASQAWPRGGDAELRSAMERG